MVKPDRTPQVIWVAGLLVLIVLPAVLPNDYVVTVLILCMLHAVLASSWNLLMGFAGIFSFGHQAFYGLGAYVSALLAMRAGLDPWLGLVAGGLAAAALGAFIAVPTLRLRAAPYIAIATLGFAEIARITASNLVGLTRGELGLAGIPPLTDLGPLRFGAGGSRIGSYYAMLGILALTIVTLRALVRSRVGLALLAIRESQDAADSLGVAVTRYKVLAFAVSSFFAGAAGAFYAHTFLVLTPSTVLSVAIMVELIAMTLVGGAGTLLGPVVGAFALTLSLEQLRVLGDWRLLIYGAALVALILFMPEGVMRRLLPGRRHL
ncbi:MAG TPA: branched-chain amino acid ABC transporter permease [Thermodesulfobacteriota bacterium]